MFRARTVVVMGAGASVEVGLPMGPELLKQIVQLSHITYEHHRQKSGDPAIVEALKIYLDEGQEVTKLNEHLKAGWQLSKSAQQALSIDNVIDALEDPRVELMGKLGIVRSILKAESASSFFRRPENGLDELNLPRFEETWYGSLTKLLTENVRKSGIASIFDNIEIINFNYDRCLEHYLPYSLSNYYGLRPDDIRVLMSGLVVHRPYGVVGRLPWQQGEGPSVDFGAGGPQQLANVAQQVRTFTERVEEGTQLVAMREAVSGADRIVFLGFAFHRQNIELIVQQIQPHTQIVATAYKISESDQGVINDELRTAFEIHDPTDPRVTLASLTCSQFFQEYWRTLTAERAREEPVSFYENP